MARLIDKPKSSENSLTARIDEAIEKYDVLGRTLLYGGLLCATLLYGSPRLKDLRSLRRQEELRPYLVPQNADIYVWYLINDTQFKPEVLTAFANSHGKIKHRIVLQEPIRVYGFHVATNYDEVIVFGNRTVYAKEQSYSSEPGTPRFIRVLSGIGIKDSVESLLLERGIDSSGLDFSNPKGKN